MNATTLRARATTFSTGARIVGLALVLALAAVAGLAAGTAISDRDGATLSNAGYPDGYAGGAAVPISHTATAAFSGAALDAVRVTRGDIQALTVEPTLSDYHDRHSQPGKSRPILTDPKIR